MPTKTTTPTPALAELRLEQINPANLIVRDQAREDATPDDDLIASVRAHGIIQPPVVEINGAGERVIVTGHRRVGAAIAAGLTEITVIVRPTIPGDEGALTLEQQIVENERRKQLTSKDLANGYQRLTLFGLRPEDIAAQLGERTERVRAALTIHKSAPAAKLVAGNPTIDLERAAHIAEFDEHPKLQKKLIDTALTRPENFTRDLHDARTHREVDARVDQLKKQLDADDVPLADVVGYDCEWWHGKGVTPGSTLTRLDIRPEEHTDCPGHAAIIHRAAAYHLNEQPDQWILYVCTDWQTNGHTRDRNPGNKLTPEGLAEREEAERQRELAAAERAAKQELITANTTARQAWIHQHLTTGRLRPTAHHFDLIALALAAQTDAQDWAPVHLALTLITGTPHEHDWRTSANEDDFVTLATSTAIPSLRVVLGNAFAAAEEAITSRFGVTYFTILEALGYTLTDTDQEHRNTAINEEALWLSEQGDDDEEIDA